MDGRWKHGGEAWTNWCEGFLGGQLWLLYERTRDDYWQAKAEHYSRLIEHRKTDRNVHDLGFLFFSTWKRWYDLTGDPALRQVVIEAGQTMGLRFREKGRYLRSFVAEESLFIDIMMNVGIVFYAAQADQRCGLAPQGDGALSDDTQISRPGRRQHVARGDLRHGPPANSFGKPRTRDGATIRPGRAAWHGRCTVSARSTTSPAMVASSGRRRRARIITSNAHPHTASRRTIGMNRTPHCRTRAPPPRSPRAAC